MDKEIFLINDIENVPKIKNNLNDKKKVFALNFLVHKKMDEENIPHEIGDKILNEEDREKIFNTTVQFHKWYLNQTFTNDFTLFGVNILGMLDTAELHSYIIHKILRFFIVKKIIESENPDKITVSSSLNEIAKEIISTKKIELTNLEEQIQEKLEYEKYSFIVNVGSKPITLNLSRKQYSFIKKNSDEFIGRIFNLWHKPIKSKKRILLLEFNPIHNQTLLEKINEKNIEAVIFNSRRPAAWNLKSLKILKRNNVKVVNSKLLMDLPAENEIEKYVNTFNQKLKLLWNNENELRNIFSLQEYSLWPIIKEKFIQIYKERLSGYIDLIFSSKILFEKADFDCIVCFNVIGETESAVLNVESSKSPSILLEHGFANYIEETQKYDPLSYYHFLEDKIAVWGDSQKKYLLSRNHIKEEQILVVGSTRHDSFFKKHKKHKGKTKKILLTLHPIYEYSGHGSIESSVNFEKYVKKICKILKKIQNIELTVKLHPGHSDTDEYVKNLFQESFENVKILQITPILELLETTDVLINLTPEAADPTTVLLEAMILEIPILQINLDDYTYDYEYIKDGSIIELTKESDMENEILKFVNDKKIQEKLITNGNNHVKKYLTNIGNASEKLVELIRKL